MKDNKREVIEILKEYVQPNRSEGFILRDATEIYDRIAPLMQEEYSLPKCLKCRVVINCIKQDASCEHQYTDRRSGLERRVGEEERRVLKTFRQFVLEDTEEHYRLAGDHDNVAQIERRIRNSYRGIIPDRRK